MLDRDNKTVLAVFPPDINIDKMLLDANGRTLIAMTVENSPAFLNGFYIDGKFYPPKEGKNNE
jgi:hypothetical protein